VWLAHLVGWWAVRAGVLVRWFFDKPVAEEEAGGWDALRYA